MEEAIPEKIKDNFKRMTWITFPRVPLEFVKS
jgi:hypothetical protein